jgi:RNA polymerase sigma factor (TIGR02999 family)
MLLMHSNPDLSHLLQRWSAGDASALDQVMPLVYERMREIAHQRLRGEPDGSLNTTALVHEAYLRLVDTPNRHLVNRSHFLALASRVMRNLIVDHARARKAVKRGAGHAPQPLHEGLLIPDDDLEAVTELDRALKRLELLDERQCRILEQRYFGGLTLEEIAAALDVSLATVKRDLRSARAWLATQLGNEAA